MYRGAIADHREIVLIIQLLYFSWVKNCSQNFSSDSSVPCITLNVNEIWIFLSLSWIQHWKSACHRQGLATQCHHLLHCSWSWHQGLHKYLLDQPNKRRYEDFS